MSIRSRRSVVAAAVTLVSVSWGASASAAPQQHQQVHLPPIVVVHSMSSCGHMDGY